MARIQYVEREPGCFFVFFLFFAYSGSVDVNEVEGVGKSGMVDQLTYRPQPELPFIRTLLYNEWPHYMFL